jgi:hypothetical protein
MTIEVFKTNIETEQDAQIVAAGLNRHFADYSVNFDLADADKILRVKSDSCVPVMELMNVVRGLGFEVSVLPDIVPSIDNYFDPPGDQNVGARVEQENLITRLLLAKADSIKN